MILNWIFPPLCIHCESTTKSSKFPLCEGCFQTLEKISPSERCSKCFSKKEGGLSFCKRCLDDPLHLKATCAVFEHFGPAASLIREWKICHRPALSRGLAAFLSLQLIELDWDPIDLIIPIPLTTLSKAALGFNPPLLLAQELGKITDLPVLSLLKREWGHPPQDHLSWEERKNLSSSVFKWKSKSDIAGKTILLIDDVIGTGATLNAAALSLSQGSPKSVYGLAFCTC